MMIHVTEEMALDAIYGGWLLGGGGGGSINGGKDVVRAVMEAGGFDICTIDEIDAKDTVLTASLVGSPSKGGAGPTPDDCKRTYEMFSEYSGQKVGALIANESGAHSITNGWIAAAATGIPMVDAACNGRAHPTGVMGAMGLEEDETYQSIQCAVGGFGREHMELVAKGSIDATSKMVREGSVQCGGFITVLRNPTTAAYVKKNAAVGTLSMCMKVGKVVRKNEGKPAEMLEGLKEFGLTVLDQGKTTGFALQSIGGFDVGKTTIGSTEITFWNEYMTAEKDGKRLATFPDLIMTLDGKSGLPICSAAIRNDMDVILVLIPRNKILLGKAMFIEKLFRPCEEATGKSMIPYIFG